AGRADQRHRRLRQPAPPQARPRHRPLPHPGRAGGWIFLPGRAGMSLPIRGKLTLWYAGSLTVRIALFGVLIDGLMHERLLARTDFELDEELHELALETG